MPAIHAYFAWLNALGPVRVQEGRYIYSLYVPPVPSTAHAHQLENFLRNRLFGRRTPMAATLAVTSACQLTCPHCSAAMRPNGQGDLDTATWQRVIGECVDAGASVITFTGGEPLLRKDLAQLVASVPKDRAVAEFFCNGLGATDEVLLSLREAGVYGIHLSLDDPDEAVHDSCAAAKGCFARSRQAARAARRAGLLVGLSTFATDASVEGRNLSRVAALAEEWGVSEISVFDGIRTGRLLHDCGPLLDAPHRRRLLAEGREVNRVHKGRLRVITQSWTNSRRGFSLLIGCLAANLQCHVTAQGDLTPCDFTPLSFGNVRDAERRRALAAACLSTRPTSSARFTAACRIPSSEQTYIETIPEGARCPTPSRPARRGADADRPCGPSPARTSSRSVPGSPSRSAGWPSRSP